MTQSNHGTGNCSIIGIIRNTFYKFFINLQYTHWKLAQIINDDPEVEVIEAVSYIVPKTPTLFTKYGFEIKELNEKDEEGRDIALAFILREEFLKRFLKNND